MLEPSSEPRGRSPKLVLGQHLRDVMIFKAICPSFPTCKRRLVGVGGQKGEVRSAVASNQ